MPLPLFENSSSCCSSSVPSFRESGARSWGDATGLCACVLLHLGSELLSISLSLARCGEANREGKKVKRKKKASPHYFSRFLGCPPERATSKAKNECSSSKKASKTPFAPGSCPSNSHNLSQGVNDLVLALTN